MLPSLLGLVLPKGFFLQVYLLQFLKNLYLPTCLAHLNFPYLITLILYYMNGTNYEIPYFGTFLLLLIK
jgi:hypothetical protein